MQLTDEELNLRLDSDLNLVKQIKSVKSNVEVLPLAQGRGNRGMEIPSMIRQLVASLANQSDETQAEIGEVFDIPQSSVSGFSRGMIQSRKSEELEEASEQGKKALAKKEEDVHSLALDNLMQSLTTLNPLLSQVTNPKELSKLAVDMSKVAANVRKKSDNEDNVRRAQVVIFAPSVKQETHYETTIV